MNIDWTARRQGIYRVVTVVLASVLMFGLLSAAPGLSGTAADPVDLAHVCSIKAVAGSEKQAADLAGKLWIDLYRIASAEPVSGYDTYTFSFLPDFEEAGKFYDAEKPDWTAVAQKAAEIIFADGSNIQPAAAGMAGDAVSVPDGCGLYLVIARGKDLDVSEYKTTVKQKDETGNVQKKIGTLAYSNTRTYTYEPELIALPSKEEMAADGTIQNTTAGNGEWIYDMTVTLKPDEGPRYGSLEIIKQLESYDTAGEAVFIFQVDAVLNGENVYSDVFPITFDAAGEKRIMVEKIPVGAQVTVREIYSGMSYELESEKAVSGVIALDQVMQAEFKNKYSDKPNGGGAVTNRFDYTIEDGWDWTQIPAGQGADEP